MALRTIDLSELNRGREPDMTYEEYRAELQKPRAERRGLEPMPAEMCMTGEGAERFAASVRAAHQANAAAKARAWANAQGKPCL